MPRSVFRLRGGARRYSGTTARSKSEARSLKVNRRSPWCGPLTSQSPTDVAQVGDCRGTGSRPFAVGWKPGGDVRREIAKFLSCHPHQFVDCQHVHFFLHQFLTARSRPSEGGQAPDEAVASLATGTTEEQRPCACSHEPRTVLSGRKKDGSGCGLDGGSRGDGISDCVTSTVLRS